jgi:hypothetical protein
LTAKLTEEQRIAFDIVLVWVDDDRWKEATGNPTPVDSISVPAITMIPSSRWWVNEHGELDYGHWDSLFSGDWL